MGCVKKNITNERVMLKMIALISMFKYTNLNIDTMEMEYDLLENGYGAITTINDKLAYIKNENIVAVKTTATVIQEADFFNENGFKLTECVLNKNTFIISNNTLRLGYGSINNYYSRLISVCDDAMKRVVFNAKNPYLILASDATAKENAKLLFEQMEDDDKEYPGYIAGDKIFDSVKTIPFGTNLEHVTKIIEVEQYLSAKWDMIYGLNSNYNMKRETLNESEIDSNLYTLLPLVDNMLSSRRQTIEIINKLINGNATVELSSSWQVLHDVMHGFNEKKEGFSNGLQEEIKIE